MRCRIGSVGGAGVLIRLIVGSQGELDRLARLQCAGREDVAQGRDRRMGFVIGDAGIGQDRHQRVALLDLDDLLDGGRKWRCGGSSRPAGCRRTGRRGAALAVRVGAGGERGDGLDDDGLGDRCNVWTAAVWMLLSGRRRRGARSSGKGGKPRIEQRRGVAVDRHRGQEEVFLGQLLVEIAEGRDLDDRRMPGNVEIRLGWPQGDGEAHEGDAEGEGEGATGKGPLGGYAGSRSQLVFPSVQWFGRQGSTPVRPYPQPARLMQKKHGRPTQLSAGRMGGVGLFRQPQKSPLNQRGSDATANLRRGCHKTGIIRLTPYWGRRIRPARRASSKNALAEARRRCLTLLVLREGMRGRRSWVGLWLVHWTCCLRVSGSGVLDLVRVSGAIWGFCLVWFFVTRARLEVTGSRFWVFCSRVGFGWFWGGRSKVNLRV